MRNASASYAFRALRALTILVLTPYLFRGLGVTGFGTWSVMFTIYTVLSMFEVGFSLGVTKFVAEHRARGDDGAVRDDLGVAVTVMGALGVVAFAGSVAVGVLADGLAAAGDEEAFRIGLFVLGASMILRYPLAAYGAALMGYQRFDLFHVAEAAGVLLLIAGSVVAIETGSGVLGLSIAYGVSLVGGGALFLVLLRRLDPDAGWRPRLGERAGRRRIGGFGGLALVADSMDFVAQRMDAIIVAALRGAVFAAPLGVGQRLASGVQGLVLPFVNLMLPMVAELRARDEHAEVVRRFVAATRMALQITLVVAAGLAVFADDLVRVWLGPTAPAVTADVIVVLMAVQVATLAATPATKVLLAADRVRAVTVLAAIEGAANIALSIVLVTRYGAIGAVLATLLTSALIVPARIPLAARAIGCDRRTLLRGLAPALVVGLPTIAVMGLMRVAVDPGTWRLALGLAAGWATAAVLTLLQAGPRRVLARVRARRLRLPPPGARTAAGRPPRTG